MNGGVPGIEKEPREEGGDWGGKFFFLSIETRQRKRKPIQRENYLLNSLNYKYHGEASHTEKGRRKKLLGDPIYLETHTLGRKKAAAASRFRSLVSFLPLGGGGGGVFFSSLVSRRNNPDRILFLKRTRPILNIHTHAVGSICYPTSLYNI